LIANAQQGSGLVVATLPGEQRAQHAGVGDHVAMLRCDHLKPVPDGQPGLAFPGLVLTWGVDPVTWC
jgi:hypothetical protein